MTVLRIAPLLLATTFLVSCSLIPDYSRPALPVSESWPEGPAYEAALLSDKKDVILQRWEDFFQSDDLREVIRAALHNNRDLRVAALNVESARQLYRIERADIFPALNAVGEGLRQNAPDNATPVVGLGGLTSQYTANIGITAFELDVFGRIRSLSRQALEEYLATREAQKAVRVALIAETANAYLTYLSDVKLLALTEETLNSQKQAFDLIAKRVELGVANQLESSQAAQSVETARANHAAYIRQVAQDKNALILLMGGEGVDLAAQKETLDSVKIVDDLPAGLPSEILLTRPDILQAEHRLKAANANIGAARAAFFPRISLTSAIGYASRDLDSLFSSDSGNAWTFSPRLEIPLFAGGLNFANLANSKITREIRVAEYERSIQVAFREVADQLAARGTFTAQLDAQQGLVRAAGESYDLSNARYRQGIENYLNVLDAQRTLYAAQQNAIIVQRQRLSNLVDLFKVLGGGGENLAEQSQDANSTSTPRFLK